jgi:hypothetical protein
MNAKLLGFAYDLSGPCMDLSNQPPYQSIEKSGISRSFLNETLSKTRNKDLLAVR